MSQKIRIREIAGVRWSQGNFFLNFIFLRKGWIQEHIVMYPAMIGHLKFLSGLHLCLLGEIFNLSLAEHNVGVTSWVLVNVGLVDHEQDILGFTNSYS